MCNSIDGANLSLGYHPLSDGESQSVLRRLETVLQGFLRVLRALLDDGRTDPEELRRFPVRLLPPSGPQSGAPHAVRRQSGTPRHELRRRSE